MRIEQLAIFADLSRTHSIRQTAKNFYISPQAVSDTMRKMEKELGGVTLLVRSKTGVTLTEQGTYFWGKAQEILDIYQEALLHLLPDWDELQAVRGNLTVCCDPQGFDSFLPLVHKDFRQRYPQVRVALQSMLDSGVVSYVSSGEAALGFVFVPGADLHNILERQESAFSTMLRENALSAKLLFKERLYFCVHKDAPWQMARCRLEDLQGIPLVSYSAGPLHFPRQQVALPVTYGVNSAEVQQRFIAQKLGVGLVSRQEYNDLYKKQGSFKCLPIEDAVYAFLIAVYREGLSPAAKAFLAMTEAYFAQLTDEGGAAE